MEALLEIPIQSQVALTEIVTEPNQVELKDSGFRTKTDKRKGMPQLFKKGQSGNPSGRPKSIWLIRDLVLEDFTKRPSEAIRRLYEERIDLYFAYGFGKPADRVELSGPDGGAIEVSGTTQVNLAIELQKRGIILPGIDSKP